MFHPIIFMATMATVGTGQDRTAKGHDEVSIDHLGQSIARPVLLHKDQHLLRVAI